jgi:subtilisin family serine protease
MSRFLILGFLTGALSFGLGASGLGFGASGFGFPASGGRPDAQPVGLSELALMHEIATRATQEAGTRNHDPETRNYNWREVVPGRFVIGYAAGKDVEARELVSARGGRVVRTSITGANFLVAEFPLPSPHSLLPAPCFLSALAESPAVRYAEPLILCTAQFTPDDQYYRLYQWGNWVMYADQAWDLTLGSRDVKVGVVDEGIDYTHPDLAQSFDPSLKGYDFVNQDPDPRPVGADEFHGTHVGGIIAASINNQRGIAGWANVTLYSCRALNDTGSGSTTDIADAIRWATDHSVRIINMSFGSESPSTVLEDAVNYAWSHGVLLVGASGNNGIRGVFFPAAYANCIPVGALDTSGVLAGFSNYGPELELVAPGVGVLSTFPGNAYAWADGTSMASPEVAGLAALLLSYCPTLTNRQLRAVIDASTIDMGDRGRDVYYGYGLVNACRAMQLTQMFGADLEPFHALSLPPALPSVLRAADLNRLLPARAVLLDAQGRAVGSSQFAVLSPGVYFVREIGLSPVSRVTVVR